MRQSGLQAEEGASGIELEGVIPVRLTDLIERHLIEDTGTADQDVQTSKLRHGMLHDLLAVCLGVQHAGSSHHVMFRMAGSEVLNGLFAAPPDGDLGPLL